MKKTVSIVVPVYNVESYIRKCVDSILDALSGREHEYELILVDDGSLDSSGVICDEYAKKNSSVVVLHKENGGAADSRNFGINNARGEYILFIDSDDYVTKDICKVFDVIEINSGVDVFQVGFSGVDLQGKILNDMVFKGDYVTNISLKDNYEITKITAPWSRIIRREFLLEKNLFFVKGRIYEDIDWSFRVWLGAERVYVTDINYYRYLMNREGSETGGFSFERFKEHTLVSLDYCMGLLEKAEINKSAKKLLKRFLGLHMYTVVNLAAKKFNKEDGREFIRIVKEHKVYLKYPYNIRTKIFRFLSLFIGLNTSFKLLRLMLRNRK